MTKLTTANIFAIIKKDDRIDPELDLIPEDDRVMIWLKTGWTWNRLDGNRTCETFNLSTCQWDEPDTISYLKSRIRSIEPYDVDEHNKNQKY